MLPFSPASSKPRINTLVVASDLKEIVSQTRTVLCFERPWSTPTLTNFPDLTGTRIYLRKLTASKEVLPEVHEYAADPAFFSSLEYGPDRTLEETLQTLKRFESRSDGEFGHYWFINLQSGKVIGTFGVLSVDQRRRSAELGYGIAPKFQGFGYFGEALGLVLKHLFLHLKLHRVWAKTDSGNEKSVRALKRAGFKEEGRLRDFYLSLVDGHYSDATMLAILESEYKQQ